MLADADAYALVADNKVFGSANIRASFLRN